MTRFLISVLLAIASCGVVEAAPNDVDASYQSMVTAAKADPQAANWQALRFAFADQPGFMTLDRALKTIRDEGIFHPP